MQPSPPDDRRARLRGTRSGARAPARGREARDDRRQAVETLLADVDRLQDSVEAARRDVPGSTPAGRWHRALYELASHNLTDLADYLGRVRGDLVPPPGGPGDEPDDAAEQGPGADLDAFLSDRYLRGEAASPRAAGAHDPADGPSGGAAPYLRPGPGAAGAAPRQPGTVGSAEWDLVNDTVHWSDEMYRLFDRPRELGPLSLDELPAYLFTEDQHVVASMVTTGLVDGKPADAEFRVVRPDGTVRTVHAVGEPVLGDDGKAVSMWVVWRDVSELRRTQRALEETRETLLRERRIAQAEHRIAVELQRAVLPAWGGSLRLPEEGPHVLDLATRYLPAETVARIGGDWYDAMPLPDGTVLVTLGDMTGHGLSAASGMAMLRNALRGLAMTGAGTAAMLDGLNRLIDQSGSETMASTLCFRFDPDALTVTWAQAGHPPPLLFRDGTAAPLDPPDGVLLGALPGARYAERTVPLRSGDVLLCYTDGLIERRGQDIDEGVRELLDLAPRICAAPSAQRCVQLALGAFGPEDYEDDTCVLAIRIG